MNTDPNTDPNNEQPTLQERMQALEKMRAIETRIVEYSDPLVRRLREDLSTWLNEPLPLQKLQKLERGELWWKDLEETFGDHDPRCFPVVREVIAELRLTLTEDHFQQQPAHEGQFYRDLIQPIRKQVLNRTRLRQIAGTP